MSLPRLLVISGLNALLLGPSPLTVQQPPDGGLGVAPCGGSKAMDTLNITSGIQQGGWPK